MRFWWEQYRSYYHTKLPAYKPYIPGKRGFFGLERARYNKMIAHRRRIIIKARSYERYAPFRF